MKVRDLRLLEFVIGANMLFVSGGYLAQGRRWLTVIGVLLGVGLLILRGIHIAEDDY